MYTAIKPAAACALVLFTGGTLMAAEVRDVGQMTGVLELLQATSADIAPATADAVGFQTAQALGLDRASNLELVQERALPNNVGRTLRFAQTYNGVRIWGQHVTVDMDADNRTVGARWNSSVRYRCRTFA